MGRQIQFRMSEGDERNFASYLREDRDVVFLLSYSSVNPPVEHIALPTSNDSGMGTDVVIRERSIGGEPICYEVRNRGYFAVDRANSEVIEFSRCRNDGEKIIPGRLWIDTITSNGVSSLEKKDLISLVGTIKFQDG